MKREGNKIYELWFRVAYKSLIQEKKIHLALRPGDRRFPAPKGAIEGEKAVIKIIKRLGSEELGILPIFDDFTTEVRIKQIVVKKIKNLIASDLKKCSPDCRGKEAVKYSLGLIYTKEFSDSDIVSLVYFDYL